MTDSRFAYTPTEKGWAAAGYETPLCKLDFDEDAQRRDENRLTAAIQHRDMAALSGLSVGTARDFAKALLHVLSGQPGPALVLEPAYPITTITGTKINQPGESE